MPIAWDSRDRRVSAAPSTAPGMAGAAGQDALHSGRTGVHDGSWHGVLWTPRPDRPRSPGWGLELETEGNVRRERRITVTPRTQYKDAGATREISDRGRQAITGRQISLKAADMKKENDIRI